ncbi:MAG: hypothetical protein LBJ58_04000 [Tannerellaceae bacterium]|nr:hypothetical protein [Tannerellaceae bacterium]
MEFERARSVANDYRNNQGVPPPTARSGYPLQVLARCARSGLSATIPHAKSLSDTASLIGRCLSSSREKRAGGISPIKLDNS